MKYRIITILALLALIAVVWLCAQMAYAYPPKVERWRPTVTRVLKAHGVGQQWRIEKTLHIIEGESGGGPRCVTGRHVGLVQFTPSWGFSRAMRRAHIRYDHKRIGTSDLRYCGTCSIHRLAHVWAHSDAKVRQHWAATW